MGAPEIETDILILGGGMAGSCLARQLKLQQPDLRITLLDRKTEFDYWIGESTVEVWADYAVRTLKLAPYLWKHHIIKHGLRFFYDSEKKDLPFAELSENGLGRYLDIIPSYQLDRQSFDRDMAEMNKELGVDVRLGVKLDGDPNSAISLDRDKGHTVRTSAGTFRCKWLIDAAGRGAPLARKLKIVEDDARHPVGAYWGRFQNFVPIDDLGDDTWKRRVNYTFRQFSTNHMMYKGYWVWLIPLCHDVLSIGVSFHHDIEPLKMKNGDDLVAFIKSHKWGRELLGDKFKTLDFMGFTSCARKASQYYSHDRWFLTGMSGFVVDALYSTTGPAAAYSNRMIGQLIATDRAGDDARFESELHHFNIFTRMRYEYFLRAISNYEVQGSFDVMRGLRQTIQSIFHNVRVPESTEDLKTLIDTAHAHQDGCSCSLESAQADMERSLVFSVQKLAHEFFAISRATGNEYTGNRGLFSDSTPRESLIRKYYYRPRPLELEKAEDLITYEAAFRHFLKRAAEFSRVNWSEGAFDRWFRRDWNSGQTLADGLAALRAPGAAKLTPRTHAVWNSKGPLTTAPANESGSFLLERDAELAAAKNGHANGARNGHSNDTHPRNVVKVKAAPARKGAPKSKKRPSKSRPSRRA